MQKSSLCDYSDAYILAKGNISIESQKGDNVNNGEKEVVFKNCDPFTDCISKINNTQIDNNKDIDVVMTEKTSLINQLKVIRERMITFGKFQAAINSALFKFKQKITGKIAANGLKGVEIMVLVKD